jgi:murein endopeptidase
MVVAPVEPEPTGTHLDLVAGRTVALPVIPFDDTPTLTHTVVPPDEVPDLEDAAVRYDATDFDLHEVRWTVDEDRDIREIAGAWGMRTKFLRELNPAVKRADTIGAGTELVVFRESRNQPPRSIGAPNRGWLRTGMAMPEGDHWMLRFRRAASFGSEHTIGGLLMALEAYGDRFPDGPRVRLGDFSRRRGHKLHPHVSHRSGRDVDVGYILHEDQRGQRYWQSADDENLDVRKTWFLLKALVQTDRVASIFVSAKLQRLLVKEARKELSAEELAYYFRRANPDPNAHSVIQHWRGHRDHMHVRFKCAGNERLCISQSVY